MLFRVILICCSAALVTQAEEVVQHGGEATLLCGIPEKTEISWFSLQSGHIPARVMDLTYRNNNFKNLSSVYAKDEYSRKLFPVSVSNKHGLQLKNITEADLLMYCCLQKKDKTFGNCTKLKFTDHPGGQSTPHPLQCPTPQPKTLNPQPETLNPDHLHYFILICFILLLCLIFLVCYIYNKALLRKSSD